VVECACGAGPGLGALSRAARSLAAGDLDESMVARVRAHYGDRVRAERFDAESLPFPSSSKDVIILFEAIYYLPNPVHFVRECSRVLRPGGHVLIATANKDLWDFHPSAKSRLYFGVEELEELFKGAGFRADVFGFQDVRQVSWRQRVLRPVKRVAVALNMIPRSMAGKRWLKRIVFGNETLMPAEISVDGSLASVPIALAAGQPDRHHKILYCVAQRSGERNA
jgi:SAM-dependent methyltransferase